MNDVTCCPLLEENDPIPLKKQPPFQGSYLARDVDGKDLIVDVIPCRIPENSKRIVLCVADWGGEGKHIPAEESGLDFYFLVAHNGAPNVICSSI